MDFNTFTTIGAVVVIVIVVVRFFLPKDRLSKGKMEKAGHGEFGTARWAEKNEYDKTFKKVEYRPDLWRQGLNLPSYEGLIVHCEQKFDFGESIIGRLANKVIPQSINPLYAYVDDSDVHTLMIGAAGVGKTTRFLYPNIEYACAAGISFFTTDTKGDLYRNMGSIAEKYYGYKVKVVDLRNPLASSHYNMLYQLNHYMYMYKKTKKISWLGKAEKSAKIISKAIITSGMKADESMGSNQYFYDSAEGIMTAILMILAEYGKKDEKHIVSCFRLIQDMMAPSNEEGKLQLQVCIDLLPENSRARNFATTALESAPETMQSIISTAMSKLLSFLDAELEQILCFKNEIDVEKFCTEKTAVFFNLPEEDRTKYFIASLFIQQFYQEMLTVADKMGGKLPKRVMYYCDEIGTMSKIEGLEEMFTAGRSRKISVVAIIQSTAQLERRYGKESAKIIKDNCQNTLFGGFAPNSEDAEQLSKSLGTTTVKNVSVSYNEKEGMLSRNMAASRQESMTSRPLMTADELKNMKPGNFILQKTGCNPFKTKLKMFFDMGIKFEDELYIPTREEVEPKYADKTELIKSIVIHNPELIRQAAQELES